MRLKQIGDAPPLNTGLCLCDVCFQTPVAHSYLLPASSMHWVALFMSQARGGGMALCVVIIIQ